MVIITELVDELKNIGFTKYESKAYIALTKDGILSAPGISKSSGVPKSRVYDIINMLISKKMIEEFPGTPRKFKARTPDFVFNEIMNGREKNLQQMKEDIVTLKKKLNDLLETTEKRYIETDNVLWTVNGREAFHEKMVEMGNKAQKEILLLIHSFARSSAIEQTLNAARARGVKLKSITNLKQENFGRVKFYSNIFEEIRNFNDELPLTVVIIDRKNCLYKMQYEVHGVMNYVGVYSENPGFIKAFLQYWNSLWETSKPVTQKKLEVFEKREIKALSAES